MNENKAVRDRHSVCSMGYTDIRIVHPKSKIIRTMTQEQSQSGNCVAVNGGTKKIFICVLKILWVWKHLRVRNE